MKKTFITCVALSFTIYGYAQIAKKGSGEMPKGNLIFFEYKTDNNYGFLYESFSAEKKSDGTVAVTVYDYYQKIDSITIDGNDEVMNHITDVLEHNMKIQDLRGDITWLNGETGQGQTRHFTGIFDSADTLRMNGYIRRHGFADIEMYLVDFVNKQKRNLKFEELEGDIPDDVKWHNGIEEFRYYPRSGTIAKRYKVGSEEIIVITGSRTKKILDVYVKMNDNDAVEQALYELVSGIYENEKGQSIFGKVEIASDEEYEEGDPGRDIHFLWNGVQYSDSIEWGERRMQRRDYSGGEGGALSGPTLWTVKYIDEGLEVEEIKTGLYAPTNPAFGKHFKLRKIRGPYKHTKDLWAIASEKPLTRGQLLKLTPKQRQDMENEIKARHSDGSSLTDIENLNIKFIESLK